MIGYSINNYVWNLLKKNLGWDTIPGIDTPFIPAQQQPEFMNSDNPFVVYSFSTEYNDGDLEPEDREIVSYLVYGNTAREVDEATTLIKNAFKAFNSADNINTWLVYSPNANAEDKNLLGKKLVTFTEVMNVNSAGPVPNEGGKHAGFISLRIGFHTDPQDYSI